MELVFLGMLTLGGKRQHKRCLLGGCRFAWFLCFPGLTHNYFGPPGMKKPTLAVEGGVGNGGKWLEVKPARGWGWHVAGRRGLLSCSASCSCRFYRIGRDSPGAAFSQGSGWSLSCRIVGP